MESDASKVSVTKEFLEAIQYAEGNNLTCQQLMAIANNDHPSIKIVYGYIQSLNYGTDEHKNLELQRVILSDTTSRVQLISKNEEDDCTANNLNDFERIFKNAADFGHDIFAIIDHKNLISVTLRISNFNTRNIVRAAFDRTKPSTNPTP